MPKLLAVVLVLSISQGAQSNDLERSLMSIADMCSKLHESDANGRIFCKTIYSECVNDIYETPSTAVDQKKQDNCVIKVNKRNLTVKEKRRANPSCADLEWVPAKVETHETRVTRPPQDATDSEKRSYEKIVQLNALTEKMGQQTEATQTRAAEYQRQLCKKRGAKWYQAYRKRMEESPLPQIQVFSETVKNSDMLQFQIDGLKESQRLSDDLNRDYINTQTQRMNQGLQFQQMQNDQLKSELEWQQTTRLLTK